MTSTKNDIRIAIDDDYDKVKSLWDTTFQEDSDSWRNWYFKYIYNPENAFLIYKEDKLASMAHFNPYSMMLNSKKILATSMAGVATREDMRKKGYAQELIIYGLNEMYDRKVAFSFLYPFDYDFYRKYGYELCYENRVYTVLNDKASDIVCHKVSCAETLEALYEKYTDDLNGYIIRDSEYQEIKFKEHFVDSSEALLIKRNKETIGYALAEDMDEKVVLSELICNDIVNAAKYISKIYGKPVEFISPYVHESLEVEVKEHCMGRVIDIVGVFDELPAKDNEIIVDVIDDIIKKNNGSFKFKASNGVLKVSRTSEKADIKLDVKELSMVAVGYQKGMSISAKVLNKAFFEVKTPWIVEVC